MSLSSVYKKISLILFGGLVDKYITSFKPLEPHIKNANMKVLLKTWISMLFLSTLLAFIISLVSIYVLLTYLIWVEFYMYVFSIIFFPVFIASIVFIVFYLYPVVRHTN